MTVLRLILSGFILPLISGCGEDSTAPAEPAPPAARMIILNQMSTSTRIRDGVTMSSVRGSNSVGEVDIEYRFSPIVDFGDSGTVFFSADQCDMFWDLSPRSPNVLSIDNSGRSTFVACGATLVCEAVLIDALGIKWGDLRGDCR